MISASCVLSYAPCRVCVVLRRVCRTVLCCVVLCCVVMLYVNSYPDPNVIYARKKARDGSTAFDCMYACSAYLLDAGIL